MHVQGGWQEPTQNVSFRFSKTKLFGLVCIGLLVLLTAQMILPANFGTSLGPSTASGYDPYQILWNGTFGPLSGVAYVGGGKGTDPTQVSISYSSRMGDFIIINEGFAGTPCGSLPAPTDTGGSSYTERGSHSVAAWCSRVYTTSATGSLASTTFTSGSCASCNVEMAVAEYSGVTGLGTIAACGHSGLDLLCTESLSSSNDWLVDGNVQTNPQNQNARQSIAGFGFFLGIQDGGINVNTLTGTHVGSDEAEGTMIDLKGNAPASSTCPPGYACVNASDNAGDIRLVANGTQSAVALTTTSINMATTASKELLFYETWANATNLGKGGFGWFLTANSTIPTQLGYNPLKDKNVVLANVRYKNNNTYTYIQRNPGITLLSASGVNEDPTPNNCPQTSTLFICSGKSGQNTLPSAITLVLNFTGGSTLNNNGASNGFSAQCNGSSFTDFTFCTNMGGYPVSPCSNTTTNCTTITFPWFNIQAGSYYLGFWANATQTSTIDFHARQSGTFIQKSNSIYYWVPNTATTGGNPDSGGFFGWIARGLGAGWDAVAGVLSPIAGPLFNVGSSILGAVSAALIAAGNAVVTGFIVFLNGIGNLVGWGPIGTDFANMVTGGLALLNEGLTELVVALTWIATLVLRSASVVTIISTAAGPIFTLTLSLLTGGVNSISIILTILYWGFLGVSLLFVILEILLFFLLLGDYGPNGFYAWFETSKWFIFGTGLRFMVFIFNFGLDIISAIISMLPKPIIQMSGIARWPRLPIFDVQGQPTLPTGQMEAAREGNVFTLFGWIIGIVFTFAYESTTLPGSIAGFVPGAASEVAPIGTLLNIMYIILFLAGSSLLFVLPAQIANAFPGLKLGDVPGRSVKLSARGPSVSVGSVGIRRAMVKKRFGGFVQKRLEHKGILRAKIEA